MRRIVLAVVFLAACGGEKVKLPAPGPTGERSVGVRVVTPSSDPGGALLAATGQIRAKRAATLSSPEGGTVERFLVDVGSRVKKGQELMRLDSVKARIGVDQAEAAKRAAEAAEAVAKQDLERARVLHGQGGLPPSGLEKAEAGYQQAAAGLAQADAALRSARRFLADHVLRAPFDGVITGKLAAEGETMTAVPSTPVLKLTDVDTLELQVHVPEALAGQLAEGAEIGGRVSPGGAEIKATLRTVGRVVDPATRTVEVIADVIPPVQAEHRVGALVELDLKGPAGDGLYLPARAVAAEGDGRFVWVVEAQTAKKRPVQIAAVNPGVVRVLSGVTQGEQVIEETAGIADGLKVKVLQ